MELRLACASIFHSDKCIHPFSASKTELHWGSNEMRGLRMAHPYHLLLPWILMLYTAIFFFFFFNCLDLFIALHLPTFDVNLILKARTYMLSTYHIVSKYRAWNILFVEQIVTTEIHCVVTMAPGTGLLYSSLNMVVFILLIHPRRLKTGKVKWIPKNTQFGGSGGARFFWPQSLYSFRANRLDLVKSDMN